MIFIIMFIFTMAYFPGVFPGINLGVFYLTPLRLGLILLPVMLVNKCNRIRTYKCVNLLYSYNRFYITFTALWFIYSVITVFWVKSFSDWAHAEYYLGLFVYSSIFFTMGDISYKDIVNVFKWLCVIIFVHNVIGWYELFFHNYFFAPPYKVEYMMERNEFYAISTFFNLNDFAFVMVFGSFVAYLSFLNSRKVLGKIVSILTVFSCMAHVIRSDSRSCIIALLLGWGIYLFFILKSKIKVNLIVWATGVITGVFIFLPDLFWRFVGIINGKLNFSFQSDVMNSDMIRVNLVRNGFEFLKRTSWFGVGSGNTENWMSAYAVYNTGDIINMHNWWMENFTNYGIIIFVLYLIFYISLIVSFWKGLKLMQGINRKTSALIISILFSFIVGLMSASTFFTTEWLWIFFAFLIALQRVEKIECKKAREKLC